jgi:hypothetical protein
MKYRYYLSSTILNGEPEKSGSVSRVPAVEIESLLVESVREHLKLPSDVKDDRTLVHDHIVRVEVTPDGLVFELAPSDLVDPKQKVEAQRLEISWQKTASTRRRKILVPDNMTPKGVHPIRSESRVLLVAAIARGRHWLMSLPVTPLQQSSRSPERPLAVRVRPI